MSFLVKAFSGASGKSLVTIVMPTLPGLPTTTLKTQPLLGGCAWRWAHESQETKRKKTPFSLLKRVSARGLVTRWFGNSCMTEGVTTYNWFLPRCWGQICQGSWQFCEIVTFLGDFTWPEINGDEPSDLQLQVVTIGDKKVTAASITWLLFFHVFFLFFRVWKWKIAPFPTSRCWLRCNYWSNDARFDRFKDVSGEMGAWWYPPWNVTNSISAPESQWLEDGSLIFGGCPIERG